MLAFNKTESVELKNITCLGLHLKGKTCVKETKAGKFAVVDITPDKKGKLRLIKLFSDSLYARRYNFAIHGSQLGE
jgi:hypothetical protein